MRRLLVFVFAVVLMGLIVVPSLAIGYSGSSDDVWYSALSFDVIEFDSVDNSYVSIPFPFNSGIDGDISEFSYFDDLVYGYQGLAFDDGDYCPYIIGRLNSPLLSEDIGISQSFTLRGGQQIFDMECLRAGYSITYDPNLIRVTSATVSFNYYYISPKSDNATIYDAVSCSSSVDVSCTGGTISWGLGLYMYLREDLELGQYVFIDHIDLTISFQRCTVDTVKFDFKIPTDGATIPDFHVSFRTWLLQEKIITPDQVDVGNDLLTWLSDSIEAFLDFQIFPGFSLNKIFYFILVIGVLLWFIKVIS